MQIHELANLSGSIAAGNYLVVDTGSATRKLGFNGLASSIITNYSSTSLAGKTQSLKSAIDGLYEPFNITTNNSGMHNSIYRGRNIGTAFTSEQSATIVSGKFDNMFVGDYWYINDITWRIAGFDVYLRKGPSTSFTKASHHIVVVADGLYKTKWANNNADVINGYVNSAVRANIKGDNTDTSGAEAKFIAAFGDEHVRTYRNYYPTAYNSDGVATAAAWTDCRVELMSEVEVFGYPIYGANGSTYETGIGNTQFPLFRLDPKWIMWPGALNESWWLRTVCAPTKVESISITGMFGYTSTYPNTEASVRPFALIA